MIKLLTLLSRVGINNMSVTLAVWYKPCLFETDLQIGRYTKTFCSSALTCQFWLPRKICQIQVVSHHTPASWSHTSESWHHSTLLALAWSSAHDIWRTSCLTHKTSLARVAGQCADVDHAILGQCIASAWFTQTVHANINMDKCSNSCALCRRL